MSHDDEFRNTRLPGPDEIERTLQLARRMRAQAFAAIGGAVLSALGAAGVRAAAWLRAGARSALRAAYGRGAHRRADAAAGVAAPDAAHGRGAS